MSEYILAHHGVKGMKWGVRRYQNPDGSLTADGRKRQAKRYQKELNKLDREASEKTATLIRRKHKYDKTLTQDAEDKMRRAQEALKSVESKTWKKMAEIIEKGNDVESQNTVRFTKLGELAATHLIGGIYGTVTVQAITAAKYHGENPGVTSKGRQFYQTPYYVQGNKYRVRPTEDERRGSLKLRVRV